MWNNFSNAKQNGSGPSDERQSHPVIKRLENILMGGDGILQRHDMSSHEPEHFRTLRLAYEVWSERKNDLAMIRQALVDQKKKRYVIKSHLKELLQESGDE
jgi:hypothetical protein